MLTAIAVNLSSLGSYQSRHRRRYPQLRRRRTMYGSMTCRVSRTMSRPLNCGVRALLVLRLRQAAGQFRHDTELLQVGAPAGDQGDEIGPRAAGGQLTEGGRLIHQERR